MHFSVGDAVSIRYAGASENNTTSGMREQRHHQHVCLGDRFKSISGLTCGEVVFRASVQQLLNAVEMMNHWSLSASDFIKQLIGIYVFLTIILPVLATSWLFTRKYPCRWMFLALMLLLNRVGHEWTLLVCGGMLLLDVAFEHINEC